MLLLLLLLRKKGRCSGSLMQRAAKPLLIGGVDRGNSGSRGNVPCSSVVRQGANGTTIVGQAIGTLCCSVLLLLWLLLVLALLLLMVMLVLRSFVVA